MNFEEEIHKLDSQIKERSEMLDQIQTEIRELEYKQVLLEADLRGLQERRRSLESYAERNQTSNEQRRPTGLSAELALTQLSLQDAVHRVVAGSPVPLQIKDVLGRLEQLGRHDRPDSVSVTLANLAKARKIQRRARGVYAGNAG